VRLAAKVYNCTPEQLPVETHQTLASLLSCGVNGMTGAIRPGCVAPLLQTLPAQACDPACTGVVPLG
jgi:hypothetical protein